jgi:hypothetical protein
MTSPARQFPPLVGHGLVGAAIAAALLATSLLGQWGLLPALLVLQVLLALGFLALVDLPASGGAFVVALAALVGADVAVLVQDGRVSALPGVVGLGLVAGLLHQLVRRDRSRVVESLAGTLVVVSLVSMAACLLAVVQDADGEWPLRVALAAAGVTLLVGRLGDRVVRYPPLTVGASRGWPGLLLGLGTATAVAALVGNGQLPAGRAALIGLMAGSTVAALDLLLDLVSGELSPATTEPRRIAALRPVSVLLPFAGLAPVVLLAVRALPDT